MATSAPIVFVPVGKGEFGDKATTSDGSLAVAAIDDALTALGNDFPEYLKNMAPAKLDKLPGVLIETAQYQYQSQFVIDKLLSLIALVFRIQQILN